MVNGPEAQHGGKSGDIGRQLTGRWHVGNNMQVLRLQVRFTESQTQVTGVALDQV